LMYLFDVLSLGNRAMYIFSPGHLTFDLRVLSE
jgi:hypothetical protein